MRTPMKRFGQLEELVGAAIFLASDASPSSPATSSPWTAGSSRAESTSEAALVISERDNVATALEALEPGRQLEIDGDVVDVREPIPSGHKVALRDIAAGEAVIKYGSPIGAGDGGDRRRRARPHAQRGQQPRPRRPRRQPRRLAQSRGWPSLPMMMR